MAHLIDRERLQDALTELASELAHLPFALPSPRLATLFDGPETYEQALGALEPDVEYVYAFSQACLAKSALADQLRPTIVDGPLSAPFGEETALYFGDLHVGGDLEYATNVVVLGSLYVGGVIHQPEEHQALIVVGDLRCASAELRGATWVRGNAEARVLYVERYGFLHAHGDVVADLVLRDSYESGLLSHYRARRVIDTIASPPAEGDEGADLLTVLRPVLVPEALIERDDRLFFTDALRDVIRAGKPFLVPEYRHAPFETHPPTAGAVPEN